MGGLSLSLCSLSNYAWESGAWESWACTCAVLFAGKTRGPDRGPVHVPLQWDQTNAPTVLLSQVWDSLKQLFLTRRKQNVLLLKRQHDVLHLHRTSLNTDTNPLPESFSAAGVLSSFRNCGTLPSRCSITARRGADKVVNRSRHGCHPCNSHEFPPNAYTLILSRTENYSMPGCLWTFSGII